MFNKKIQNKMEDIALEEILVPSDVLLIVSPLMEIIIPPLGIHLLQACCRDVGIDTSVFYSNLLYAKIISTDIHRAISSDKKFLLGELIFAAAAFNIPTISISQIMHEFPNPTWMPDHAWQIERESEFTHIPEHVVSIRKWLENVDLKYLESSTKDWLHALAREIVKIGFPIVGCSSTLGGLVPSIALLNCVKKADPKVITIIGGAFCEAEMAGGILSLDTDIDYIFSGEGEITFPALVKQILKGRLPKDKIIYGKEVKNLDSIPPPDYRDYMRQKKKIDPYWISDKTRYPIPFETSRGCWYGKCSFCGMNRNKNSFRSKSPDRIVKDIKTLVERHGMNIIYMTDSMMPLKYFDTLLPRLSSEIPQVKIFYEMSANLTMDQVLSLKKAGITRIQTGIESLSPSLLKRMHKPYTVRGNILLLRYARSVDIDLNWNFLYGLPGDQITEYEEMLHLLPLVHHLQPPIRFSPLDLYRFSKYQKSPEKFGISNLRPIEVLKHILPPYAEIDKITYYLAADFPSQSRENPEIVTILWEEIQRWCSAWTAFRSTFQEILLPTLHVTCKSNGRYVVEDSRGLPGRPKRMEIDRDQASLLLVARPIETVPDVDIRWAVDAGLGVVMESWFVPLATAEPKLLQEFERECVK
jgi:ribosomal peptide maturation radical SAM protein 1